MSEPDETDQMTRDLDAIFADFYAPPTEMDLRGVDAATFALGLAYGFDSWKDVRVAANSHRRVAAAGRHWSQEHPSREFLSHAVGGDERSLEHLRLLERAHPGCTHCEDLLAALRSESAGGNTDALADEVLAAWLNFQPAGPTRGEIGATGPLHVADREGDRPIRAEHMGGAGWRVTVRDTGARRATIRIRWTGGHETVHLEEFENDLAVVETEAPEEGAAPEGIYIQVTGASDDV
jgi:hypothetical protein